MNGEISRLEGDRHCTGDNESKSNSNNNKNNSGNYHNSNEGPKQSHRSMKVIKELRGWNEMQGKINFENSMENFGSARMRKVCVYQAYQFHIGFSIFLH